MREHEVPTHVQAEDRVLLWFTFPQIVALMAVAALAYGVYRYAPIGPGGVRMALAVGFALVGAVLTAGQVGGRRLPAVAADLLRYALGPRRYEGQAADLVRAEAPAPAPAAETPGLVQRLAQLVRRRPHRDADPDGALAPAEFPAPAAVPETPGLLQHLAQKARRRLRRERPGGERRNGRRRPGLGWLKSVRRRRGSGKPGDDTRRQGRRSKSGKKRWFVASVAAAALLAALLPQTALAQGQNPAQQQWRSGDIAFEPAVPVPGRRLYLEALEVSGGRARVTVRAAAAVEVRAQAYGGAGGRHLVTSQADTLVTGQAAVYDLPLTGDAPSLTLSWVDRTLQAGAVSLLPAQLPHPLPAAEGELCALRVTSLAWRPDAVDGTVAATCVTSLEETLTVDTVTGHRSEQAEIVRLARVTAVTGTVTVGNGTASVRIPFVRDGVTPFSLPVGAEAATHRVSLAASLQATLAIPLPPVVALTHHPARVEQVTRTVQLYRPGDSDYDSQTVTVTHDDGTTSSATASAYASVPSVTVSRDVTVDVPHKEHVRAEVVDRGDLQRTRRQATTLQAAIFADAPYRPLTLHAPEPTPPVGTQSPSGDGAVQEQFRLLGWAWPW